MIIPTASFYILTKSIRPFFIAHDITKDSNKVLKSFTCEAKAIKKNTQAHQYIHISK